MSEPAGKRPGPWVAAAELTAIAFEFTGAILAGVILGYLADRKLDTEPWLLIVFTLLGSTAGFARLVHLLVHFQRRRRSS